jgi:hypothetical protein
LIYVPCSSCGIINDVDAFGWEIKACKSCGNQICHPTSKSRGSHLKGNGVKNNKRFSLMLPKKEMEEIEKLAEEMKTTSGSIIRFMVRLSLDMLY